MSEDSGPTDAGQMTGKHAGIWTWLVSMAATTGLICLCARWGWQGVVTGAVLATTVSLFAGLAAWIADGPGKSVRAGRRALTAALLVTASLGLVGVFDLAGVFVVLLLAGSAPALTSLVRRQWPGRHPAPAQRGGPRRSREKVRPPPKRVDGSARSTTGRCVAAGETASPCSTTPIRWRIAFPSFSCGRATWTSCVADPLAGSLRGSRPVPAHPATRSPSSPTRAVELTDGRPVAAVSASRS